MDKTILLFSGGLDSYLGWELLGRPQCLYIPVGHRYQEQEQRAIMKLEHLTNGRLQVDVMEPFAFSDLEQEDAEIKARNAYFLMYAANFADVIYLVVQSGETSYRDTDQYFFIKMSQLLSHLYERKIRCDSPFWNYAKGQTVARYLDKGLSEENLHATWSCHKPKFVDMFHPDYSGPVGRDGVHCGECNACFRRWVAFEVNGIKGDFAKNPWESKVVNHYITNVENGCYTELRRSEIIIALKRKEVV